jgi:arabinofuranosyltransferase
VLRAAVRDKGVLLACGAALAVMALGFEWSREYLYNVCDDSLISLQYARNVAEGRGFVFNPGERVEGYTNFLWVALTALLYPLSDGTSEGFVKLASSLSILLSGANIVLLYLVARRAWRRGLLASAIAVGLCLVDNDYSVWAMQAMETQLLIFTMLCSMLCLWQGTGLRSGACAGVFLALAVMTRPDAALWPAVLFFSELVAVRQLGADAPARRFVVVFAVAAMLYGAYFAWRFDYFGYLLPNTYYVKAEGLGTGAIERGLEYVNGFLRVRAYAPLIALGAFVAYRDRIARALLAWALLHAAYVVYVGGDFYPGHRFLVVLVPAIALLTGDVLGRLLANARAPWVRKTVPLAGATVIAVVAILGWFYGPRQLGVVRESAEIDRQRRVANWLGSHAPPNASIAAFFLGQHGYYSRLYVHDILGLIDPDIAHRKVEHFGRGAPGHEKRATEEEILEWRPTFIRHRRWARDFYEDGYYFDPMFPAELSEPGVWRLDELEQQGAWLEGTHIAFEERPYQGWSTSGQAFAQWPTRARSHGRRKAHGGEGWWLDSYRRGRGDVATGEITSAPFELLGDLLVLRVGGGRDAHRLRVELLVDGAVVHGATGAQSVVLARHSWDITHFKGKQARLRVTDDSRDHFGHITVDEIRQWARSSDNFPVDQRR